MLTVFQLSGIMSVEPDVDQILGHTMTASGFLFSQAPQKLNELLGMIEAEHWLINAMSCQLSLPEFQSTKIFSLPCVSMFFLHQSMSSEKIMNVWI